MGYLDVGIGFGILEFNVVFGAILLDQRVFQRQRFDLCVANNIVKLIHGGDHFISLHIFGTVLKILRNAIFQLSRFSHVNDLACAVFHDIYARAQRQAVGLFQQALLSFDIWHQRTPL